MQAKCKGFDCYNKRWKVNYLDKVILILIYYTNNRKIKKEDNWFSLYKTKTIGGNDSD